MAPFVPTEWYGEKGYFGIGTGTRLDLSLNGVGTRSAELELIRESDNFEVRWAHATTFLGQVRPEGEVTVFPTSDEGNVFGTIGALFFADRTLALDPAGPHVGVSDRPFEPPAQDAWLKLEMAGSSGLPVTEGVGLVEAPELRFATLFSSLAPSSTVSKGLAERSPKAPSRVALAPRARLEVPFEVGEAPSFVVPVGGDIEVVLGADVLCRFLTVFDFPRRRIWMRAYPGAVLDGR